MQFLVWMPSASLVAENSLVQRVRERIELRMTRVEIPSLLSLQYKIQISIAESTFLLLSQKTFLIVIIFLVESLLPISFTDGSSYVEIHIRDCSSFIRAALIPHLSSHWGMKNVVKRSLQSVYDCVHLSSIFILLFRNTRSNYLRSGYRLSLFESQCQEYSICALGTGFFNTYSSLQEANSVSRKKIAEYLSHITAIWRIRKHDSAKILRNG